MWLCVIGLSQLWAVWKQVFFLIRWFYTELRGVRLASPQLKPWNRGAVVGMVGWCWVYRNAIELINQSLDCIAPFHNCAHGAAKLNWTTRSWSPFSEGYWFGKLFLEIIFCVRCVQCSFAAYVKKAVSTVLWMFTPPPPPTSPVTFKTEV